MNTRQIVGIVLLVIGGVLLAAGFSEYGGFGSKLGRAFGAGMSNRTLFLFIAGGASSALGLAQLLRKR